MNAIPQGVERVLERLRKAGFRAYIAGGAVRDMIMGNTPHDYDIATNALPDEIKALFTKTIDTGLRHGTVTVVENNVGYEVTTFRRDGNYSDNRRPDNVRFVSEPREDCLRRDFAMNAMMLDETGGIIDYFGGRADIDAGLIRTVGEARRRFEEDALRMLRAVRFAAQLGFEIEAETAKAIAVCAPLIRHVSAERILSELNKILLSDRPGHMRLLHRLNLLRYIMPELERCFGEPQRNRYHIYDVGEHIMHAVENAPKDLTLRWAALLHDIGKPCCSSTDASGVIHFYGHHRESRIIALDILHRFHMDGSSIKDITLLVEQHDYRIEANYVSVKRMMAKTGAKLFEKLILLQRADNMAKNTKYLSEKLANADSCIAIYHEILASKQPYRLSELAVNGRDLMNIGYRRGVEVGDALKELLNEVIIEPELNNRAYLLREAKRMRGRGRR